MNNQSNKIVILVAIFFIFVTGCLSFQIEDDDKKEIKEYIEGNIGLEEYELSDTFEKVKDEEGYEDEVWTVTDKDGISFNVIKDYYYSIESTKSSIEDDYKKTVFYKYYDELEKKDNITIEEQKDRSVSFVYLKCEFANKEELTNCFDSIKTYYDFYKSKNELMNFSYELDIKSNYDNLAKFVSYIGSSHKISQNVFDEVMLQYYTYGVYYQDSKIMSLMTDEDLNNVLNSKEVQKVVGTKYIAKNNTISFETLYKLLKDNKYRVSGNQNKFTAYDKTGTKYEFSNSFYTTLDNGYRAYYYLKNNKQESGLNYIDANKVYDLFALSITLENNK